MAVVVNGIQRLRSIRASSWCPSSDEDIWVLLWFETWEIFHLRHSDNLSALLQTEDLCAAEAQAIAKQTVATLKHTVATLRWRQTKIAIYSGKMWNRKQQS